MRAAGVGRLNTITAKASSLLVTALVLAAGVSSVLWSAAPSETVAVPRDDPDVAGVPGTAPVGSEVDEDPLAPGNPRTMGFDTPVVNPQVGTRPLLVVLMDFTDQVHDPVLTPAFVRNQIFGPRPSLNDYYLETSYGQFSFSDQGNWAWITAWNDPATASADESTRAYWNTAPDPTYNGGTFQRWGLKSLDIAGFNFAPLDFNTDGKVDFGQEVAYLLIDANTVGNFGGAMRGMPSGFTFDGKAIVGVSCGVSSGTPWITLYAHELAHQTTWGGPNFETDYYGIIPQIIGQFTLMGFSGFGSSPNTSPNGPHHFDPFSKLKMGWYTGTAVTSDGFVSIPNAETTKTAFILYEPAHGKDEYFMVENRWKGTSYDNTDALIGPLPAPFAYQGAAADIPDEGLLIWHVDETRDWNGSSTGGFAKVDLIRRGGSDNNAAFDGSDFAYYDFHDGSSTENAKWNGGANSKTGVWCVSPRAATMTAYLDVAGPGVLVCSAPLAASAIPGSAASVSVPVRNTGDATDTFEIIASGVPSDVTVTLPSSASIASKALSNMVVQLTPVRACTTSPGPRVVTLTARSTTNNAIAMSITATLTVLPFSEPEVTLTVLDNDIEPTETGTYTVNVVNHGNALDTIALTFTAIDFGLAYRALPTAIPMSWVALGAPSVTAAACAGGSTSLAITVPPDWAAMEDATYQFTVTAAGGITSDSDAIAGSLIVRATPVSMMYYVKVEIMALEAEVLTLPPSDVRDGLQDKTTAALEKLCQALDRYLLGDDPPAANLIGATIHKLEAFLHLVDAQDGKELTAAQAASLRAKANQIIADLEAVLAVM